ncbi:DUF1343 domain-containing protein [Treponema phagedenis]|uniref:DUF1343 domain-containing protein n=1 Tax=Treponema phagedenis TaxID=162 RepID=A0A0B7GXY2_TREPH|nr:DUF1343 domain-containing protein [Treponema phagedenis]EFW36344.1 hypothetical protein HMPREF9554_03176 [Treponema phagedenis F0421]NVP23398.1 DUF1343 domain-containing protein [Treponema phagedenis]QEJ95618.1 DUF1343 domain-containing protein [Treponema phagedenis]QEJ98541.1 DUF1343 domain-containing protein [Treponema phagedenis]QEK01472.1 DUF1343 domain-containing protein [Treponema phagedenis]
MKKLLCIFSLLCCTIFLFAEKIILGIERVYEHRHLFEGKRVGLITNQTGINAKGVSSIDILAEAVNLTALFSPEHGIRGDAREGAAIEDTIDAKTGLTVYSLYGKTKRPTEQMVQDIDILCFDIQDVGARFYTYIYTMAYAMEACAKFNKTFVVFDRPNPISGSAVEGTILDMEYRSFVGYYPIVQRHGMTVGELARLFNTEYKIQCTLHVIAMKNWDRNSYFNSLPLPWIPTSPNIPSAETALLYAGICVFEGTNISVGRGTTMPFQYIGAPFIDAPELADSLNRLNLSGLLFVPAYFTPSLSLHKNIPCKGVQIIVTDKAQCKPVYAGFVILYTIRELYQTDFKIINAPNKYCGLNLLTGTNKITENKLSLTELDALMQKDTKRFMRIRRRYLLY